MGSRNFGKLPYFALENVQEAGECTGAMLDTQTPAWPHVPYNLGTTGFYYTEVMQDVEYRQYAPKFGVE